MTAVWLVAAIVTGVARWFVPAGDGLLTLTWVFLALAVGQMWWGSLADRHRDGADR